MTVNTQATDQTPVDNYLADIPALCEQLVLRHQGVAIPGATVIIHQCGVVQPRLCKASGGVVWDDSIIVGGGVVANYNTSITLDLIAPA